MFILCRAAKNEPRKRAKTFPLGSPCDCRSSKWTEEKDIDAFTASLAKSSTRAAGGESKRGFVKKLVELGAVNDSKTFLLSFLRASFVSVFFFKTPTQRLELLTFASCCALAPAKTHCGVPRGIRPLGSFLGYFLGKTKK